MEKIIIKLSPVTYMQNIYVVSGGQMPESFQVPVDDLFTTIDDLSIKYKTKTIVVARDTSGYSDNFANQLADRGYIIER